MTRRLRPDYKKKRGYNGRGLSLDFLARILSVVSRSKKTSRRLRHDYKKERGYNGRGLSLDFLARILSVVSWQSR